MTAPALTALPSPRSPQSTSGGWCSGSRTDPITGLVAFPDFHMRFPGHLGRSLQRGAPVGLAIGDVDHLKAYVENANAADPTQFGHLAGNAFMAELGAVTRQWFDAAGFERGCASTFGGDEVILVAETTSCEDFRARITTLRDQLRSTLPRQVSFAFSVIYPTTAINESQTVDCYLQLVSTVDRALFAGKAARDRCGEGFVIDAHDTPVRR